MGDLERRLAELLESLAEASPAPDKEWLQGLAGEARHQAGELARASLAVPDSRLPVTTPDEPVALAELLVDRYLEAADRLQDEEAVARAQTCAGRAINRLAWLRADLPEISAHRDKPEG